MVEFHNQPWVGYVDILLKVSDLQKIQRMASYLNETVGTQHVDWSNTIELGSDDQVIHRIFFKTEEAIVLFKLSTTT